MISKIRSGAVANINQRLRAALVDLAISSGPFFILGPLAYFWSQSSGAGPIIAQMALILGIIFSAILFIILLAVQGWRRQLTPGQRWAKIAYRQDDISWPTARRLLPGIALFILATSTGWYSLLLIYPAVLLLTGRSPAEWLGQQQLISTAASTAKQKD